MDTKKKNTEYKQIAPTTKYKKNLPNNKELYHNRIILSHISQSSNIFAGPGQGMQCIPNCILSLIYNMYKNCKFWTHKDLTHILHSGNILYNSTGKSTTLLVSELLQYIKLYNFIYKVEEKNSIIGDIFEKKEVFNLLGFNKVEEFIISNKKCILILGTSSISVQYIKNKFYTFDPHKHNTYGFPDSNGCAIVLKFNSFNIFYLYICKLARKLNSYTYELIPISITKYNSNESEQEKINQIMIDNNKKIKTTDNINSNKEIENSTKLNSKEIEENNRRKMDNITTEINKKVINSPKKRKIEEVLEFNENNILNNKRNKIEKNYKILIKKQILLIHIQKKLILKRLVN